MKCLKCNYLLWRSLPLFAHMFDTVKQAKYVYLIEFHETNFAVYLLMMSTSLNKEDVMCSLSHTFIISVPFVTNTLFMVYLNTNMSLFCRGPLTMNTHRNSSKKHSTRPLDYVYTRLQGMWRHYVIKLNNLQFLEVWHWKIVTDMPQWSISRLNILKVLKTWNIVF